MLKYKNIHSRVQGELKRKINALDRKRLDGKNLNFFLLKKLYCIQKKY